MQDDKSPLNTLIPSTSQKSDADLHASRLDRDQDSDLSGLWRELDTADFSCIDTCTRMLYRVLANSYKMDSYSEAMNALLLVGVKRYGCHFGMLTHPISDQVHELQAYAGRESDLYVGQHISVRADLCHTVSEKGAVLAKINAEVQATHANGFGDGETSAEYNHYNTGSYLGRAIDSKDSKASVICFIDKQPRINPFTEDDMLLLDLMGEGIACMLEQQTAISQRKKTDFAMFTSGSIKSLEEYLEQAKLPTIIGVASRVVEALEKRVGHSSLSIGSIADELKLSKRTLQRRLYQHDISFAELRDQVRFHYSIDYLIRQHMSIDAISLCLDFSDRTSFTNAFKRWTGLSPSTFRKIFRDYV